MKYGCPNPKCTLVVNLDPTTNSIVRNGFYFRKSDSRRIERFHCRRCNCFFSKSTWSDRYCQKVRRINEPLRKLLVSGVSQRRAAIILRVDRKTVVRRFRFLAQQARAQQAEWLEHYKRHPPASVQFDDLETSIHSKCQPVSVALAVEPNLRKIISFHVSPMPAKGLLAKFSRIKYGPRKDERPQGWTRLMEDLKPHVQPKAEFTSDENPHYPAFVKKHHPEVIHRTTLGGRGAITGQGELKKLAYDPLFSLNH
jgi:transposase-like protein